MFGTMYIPYRKAYISGMNPLSFVTIFTFGELGTILTLGWIFYGGAGPMVAELHRARPMLFWPFVGGFCWVIGDLFQQYAAKYIGIGRGIPLSNTNQLWGLAWGALVFGEFAGLTTGGRLLILAGSTIMIAGAVSISMAEPAPSEMENWNAAMHRECDRYGMDTENVAAVVAGDDPLADHKHQRRWWEVLIVLRGSGNLCLAGLGHARAAHLCEPAVDDGADCGHDHSAGTVRDAVVAEDAVFVRDEGAMRKERRVAASQGLWGAAWRAKIQDFRPVAARLKRRPDAETASP